MLFLESHRVEQSLELWHSVSVNSHQLVHFLHHVRANLVSLLPNLLRVLHLDDPSPVLVLVSHKKRLLHFSQLPLIHLLAIILDSLKVLRPP